MKRPWITIDYKFQYDNDATTLVMSVPGGVVLRTECVYYEVDGLGNKKLSKNGTATSTFIPNASVSDFQQ